MDKFIFSVIVGLIGGTLLWFVVGGIIGGINSGHPDYHKKPDSPDSKYIHVKPKKIWLICVVSLTLIMLLFGWK